MKEVNIIVFFIMSLNYSCSQEIGTSKIVKYQYPATININDTVRVQEMFFNKGKRQYQLNYAYNGWQVIDSIVYNYGKTDSICYQGFQANYDTNNPNSWKFVDYSSSQYESCYLIDKSLTKDNYSLILGYYSDIISTYSNKNYTQDKIIKNVTGNKHSYQFIEAYNPTVLINWGIPYNEILDSLSYKKENGFLVEDEFNFRNYIITRKYFYEQMYLKEVVIMKIDKKRGTNKKFKEFYTYTEK